MSSDNLAAIPRGQSSNSTLSPAVLSRIESGDRSVSLEEVQDILTQLGTPEAAELSKALQRTWLVLPRPPLDHPDQDLLWAAEQVARELAALRDQPDTPHAFERRLSEYIDELGRGASLLLKREHQVAFIGSIGVGKSTAICRMTGLEVPKEDGTMSGHFLRRATSSMAARSILIAAIGSAAAGICLSLAFSFGTTDHALLVLLAILLCGIALPIHRAESLFGFVLAMVWTFGPILPILIGSVIVLFSVVVRRVVWPALAWATSRLRT